MTTETLILRKRLKREALVELNAYMGQRLDLDQYLNKDEIMCRISLKHLFDRNLPIYIKESNHPDGLFYRVVSYRENDAALLCYIDTYPEQTVIGFPISPGAPRKITMRIDVDDKYVELENWALTREDPTK